MEQHFADSVNVNGLIDTDAQQYQGYDAERTWRNGSFNSEVETFCNGDWH